MTTTQSRSFLVPSTTPISTQQTLDHLHTLRHGDEWAINMIAEHRALTTDQLLALGYDHDPATADKRLKRLVRLGWLRRHRHGPGFTARGYLDTTLGSIGPFGMAITTTDNKPVSAAQAYRDKARLVRDPHLPHLMDVNQFFVALATYARTHRPRPTCGPGGHPSPATGSPRHHGTSCGTVNTCTMTAASDSDSNPTTGPPAPPPAPRTSTGITQSPPTPRYPPCCSTASTAIGRPPCDSTSPA